MSEVTRLGDVCTAIVDCEHKTAPEATPGTEYGYSIGTPHIRNGRILLEAAKKVDKETYLRWTARAVPRDDDLILAREAPVGQVGRVTNGWKICLGQRTVLLRPQITRVDPRYLHYLLLSPAVQEDMAAKAAGSTVPHLNVKEIRELVLPPLPPLAYQAAVAATIGVMDDKIAVNERIATTSRQLGLKLFSLAVLEGEALNIEVESASSTLTRGVAPKYSDHADDLLVLNQKCIRDGRVTLGPARLTLRDKVKAPKLLHRNDVLVNSTGVGTLGRVARWTLGGTGTVDSHITILRFDEKLVDPVCAGFAMLRSQPEIEAMGEGSTGQTELRRAQLGRLEITLPSNAQQQQLRPKLDALEERADQALAESLTLASLRDALLPQLMSGRVRVKDAEKIVEDHA